MTKLIRVLTAKLTWWQSTVGAIIAIVGVAFAIDKGYWDFSLRPKVCTEITVRTDPMLKGIAWNNAFIRASNPPEVLRRADSIAIENEIWVLIRSGKLAVNEQGIERMKRLAEMRKLYE